MSKPEDIKTPRWDRDAESRFMAEANDWVMVRRPHCVPYTMRKADWLKLPTAEEGREIKALWDRGTP